MDDDLGKLFFSFLLSFIAGAFGHLLSHIESHHLTSPRITSHHLASPHLIPDVHDLQGPYQSYFMNLDTVRYGIAGPGTELHTYIPCCDHNQFFVLHVFYFHFSVFPPPVSCPAPPCIDGGRHIQTLSDAVAVTVTVTVAVALAVAVAVAVAVTVAVAVAVAWSIKKTSLPRMRYNTLYRIVVAGRQLPPSSISLPPSLPPSLSLST
ncbi:hypothetical protein ACMFMG_009811 [Clarireedia jacksonii]